MKHLLLALCFFHGSLALAEEVESDATLEEPAFLLKEAGVSLGFPAMLNANLGVWGTADLPLLVRASGGYIGTQAYGAQLDVGWVFDREGSLLQFLAATVARSHSRTDEKDTDFGGVGLSYGLNWSGFSFQLGGLPLMFVPHPSTAVAPVFQVGYSQIL
ncbi:hypothetical protein K2X33_10275 [bacterium]|nr:hypothetical protein [bacterium]